MTTESQQYNNTENDEMSLKELILKIREWWRYLLSKWMVILLFVLLGGILGFTYAYFKKPVYTATTTFVLEDEKAGSAGLGNLAGLASMAGVDLGGSGGGIFQGDNILELYKSRTMIQKTLLTPVDVNGKKQLLIDRYIEFNGLRDKWKSQPLLKDIRFGTKVNESFTRVQDSIIGAIVNDINNNYLFVGKPDKKLSIIKADVKSKDELFAKAFNDEIVKTVNEFYVNTKTKKTLQNVQILQHKTDSVRAVMNGSIYAAVAIADATPNLNPTRQVQRAVPSQKAQFSAETNKSILAEMVKNLEMTKMSLLKETPLIQVVDTPIYPLSVNRYSKAKSAVAVSVIFCILISIFLIMHKSIIDLLKN